ncbi:golgin subfamily A member 6-like protein 22 [Hibiscus syriacus]|uniref:golgin subfamily A member 6-like protein 22 n=1 Tax=Hibiscus syriacus TaxID=106335 RepID=UPI001922E369|nr:golgin subfamily A member 6-like protein 22 [Hibiscus syriacus]
MLLVKTAKSMDNQHKRMLKKIIGRIRKQRSETKRLRKEQEKIKEGQKQRIRNQRSEMKRLRKEQEKIKEGQKQVREKIEVIEAISELVEVDFTFALGQVKPRENLQRCVSSVGSCTHPL